MERKNAWNSYSERQLEELEELNKGYREFLSDGKTERECVELSVRAAEEFGYKNLYDTTELKPGDKVYATHHNKTIVLYQIGTEPIEKGLNILGAHIDSPRLDLKPNPLYESGDMAYLDTHYYGGIKKYLWTNLPMALHGVVAKKDGTVVKVVIGEDENDPVVAVSDLMIHIAKKQMEKPAATVVEGEDLDVIIGSRPLAGEEKDKVKAYILAILKEKYGMEEEDFLSAEIEVVPAGKAREFGIDRSMIMSYGQDDRVCAYTSLVGMLSVENPKRTACCILVDKEEIGSVGATGMHSHFFENTVAEILERMGGYNGLKLRRTLSNSCMLSSDVSSAFDAVYADAFSPHNVAYFGRGVVFNKYTGGGGKSGSNDASAEYVGKVRKVLDDQGVHFQICEIGRVDLGGGGTIAFIPAAYGMDVIDAGVPLIGMHSPWEIVSKADVYEAKRCYVAFLEGME